MVEAAEVKISSSKLARKYLGSPVTTVPCELFLLLFFVCGYLNVFLIKEKKREHSWISQYKQAGVLKQLAE